MTPQQPTREGRSARFVDQLSNKIVYSIERLSNVNIGRRPVGVAVFVPKLVTTLKGYTRAQFTADLTAGVIVGIIALPLAIAFAIASGVTPDRGLWTAIIAGFLISALGGGLLGS